MDYNKLQLDFLVSALHPGKLLSTENIFSWIKQKNAEIYSEIKEIPLSELKQWHFQDDFNRLSHKSGKFFSIEGIKVNMNWGLVREWEQPIINQPEMGFLGIIIKNIQGVLHFLMQAKIEPGNINIVQLSPTLQATRSNYTQVHKGKIPLYLEYFNRQRNVEICLDQLQSEQGARFLKKRNRNIIVKVADNEDIPVYDNFIWMTLRQIKELLRYDNVVNMDTRTVIAAIPFGAYSRENLRLFETFNFLLEKEISNNVSLLNSVLSKDNALHDTSEIIKWITARKFSCELDIEKKPLKNLKNWNYDGNILCHETGKYFSVIGVDVRIESREVVHWDQPMVKSAQEGILAFLIKKINNVYHFLVQVKAEAGNFDLLELAPTVQCLTGNYRTGFNEYSIPFINAVLFASKDRIWYSAQQSEEGGRFFKEQNLNMIVEVEADFDEEVPENFCWMTLNQLISFSAFNNYLNIGARSLLAAVSF
jgi:oxidase EvaA